MLEFINEAFHQMALAIQILVLLALFFAMRARRNDGARVLRLNLGDKGVRVIALIGDHKVARKVLD